MLTLSSGLSQAKGGVYYAFCWLRTRMPLRHSWIKQRWSGADDLKKAKQVAIFVHHDPKGVVHDYVWYFLNELRSAGYAVVFVTNGPRPKPAVLDKLLVECPLVLWRRNRGYDFGAYKDALQELPNLADLDSLILANDSVYGPIQPLAPVLAKADQEHADIWGITDTYDRKYHLQSYFLLIHRKALRTPTFLKFWRGLVYVQDKRLVVQRFEVGFSQRMLEAGLTLSALYPYRTLAYEIMDEIRQLSLVDPKLFAELPQRDHLKWMHDMINAGVPINPSHFFWEHLLVRHRFPFIKRELLTKNPCKVPMTAYWETVIRRVSTYPPLLIERHLQHALRNRSV